MWIVAKGIEEPKPSILKACLDKWEPVPNATTVGYELDVCRGGGFSGTEKVTDLLVYSGDEAYIIDQFDHGGRGPYSDYSVDATGPSLACGYSVRKNLQ
jgi:hypothetical protein